jgi:hypothetical protein
LSTGEEVDIILGTVAILIGVVTFLEVGATEADPVKPDVGSVVSAFFATVSIGNEEASAADSQSRAGFRLCRSVMEHQSHALTTFAGYSAF